MSGHSIVDESDNILPVIIGTDREVVRAAGNIQLTDAAMELFASGAYIAIPQLEEGEDGREWPIAVSIVTTKG